MPQDPVMHLIKAVFEFVVYLKNKLINLEKVHFVYWSSSLCLCSS